MRRLVSLLALPLLLALPAAAQTVQVIPTCGSAAMSVNQAGRLFVTPDGNLCTNATGGGGGGQVTGNVASGTTDSGNPVKVGARVQAVPTTQTDGQRTDATAAQFGGLWFSLADTSSNVIGRVVTFANDALSYTQGGLHVNSRTSLWNGSAGSRASNAPNAARGDGTGVAASNPVPTTGNVGIARQSSNGSNSLALNAARNLYSFGATLAGTAGYLVLLDAAAAPGANAAISPVQCIRMAADTSWQSPQLLIPDRYTNGIQVLASTSCSTFTAPTNTALNLNASVQ